MVKISKIKDLLFMNPLRKYEVYGKFPWKLIIQILLVLFTTCQTLLIVNQSSEYSYSQYTLWNKLFLNRNVQGSDTSITNSFYIFNSGHLQSYILENIEKYYDINSHTIENYNYDYNSDGTKVAPKLLVEYYDNSKAFDLGYKIEYDLGVNNLGPFSEDDVQEYLDQVKKIEIRFKIIHKLPNYLGLASNCYTWNIIQKYDYSTHGTIFSELAPTRTSCGVKNMNILKNYIWISIFVTILAISSLIITGRYINRRLLLLIELTGVTSDTRSAWESLRISEKLRFFNFWIIIVTIGNLCQIFSGILFIIDQDAILKVHEILVGFGCFFAWISIVQFLNHTSHAYTVVNAIERSSETIRLYIVGIVPTFMGYTFMAMCIFWQTGIYPNTPMGLIANYALLNGDSVYAFSSAGYQESPFLGQLYYYTFIVFYICIVHKLFIVIIEKGFRSLRKNPPKIGEGYIEEEEDMQKQGMEMEQKKNQAQKAFKLIINADSHKDDSLYNEDTLNAIQNMDIQVQEIIRKFNTLKSVILSYDHTDPEYGLVEEYFRNTIILHIEPIIKYLE